MFAKRKTRRFIEITKLSSLIAEDVEITRRPELGQRHPDLRPHQ